MYFGIWETRQKLFITLMYESAKAHTNPWIGTNLVQTFCEIPYD
jgi:hypothetical protein